MTNTIAAAIGRGRIDKENPWPGLASFEESDEAFFHGRDAEVAALLGLIAHEDLVLLYGPSGLGKTSLLRAGVFPKLPPSILPVYLRLHFGPRADLRRQVLEAVEREAARRSIEIPPRAPTGTLWEYFRRRDPSCAFWGPGDQLVLPLLVFDQFEQLFTRDPAAIPQRELDEFLSDLGDLVNGRIPSWLASRVSSATEAGAEAPPVKERFLFDSPGCKALFSFREDFLADVKRLDVVVPGIDRNALRLEPMKWRDAVTAVRRCGSSVLAPLTEAASQGDDTDVAAAIVDIVAGRDRAREDLSVEPAILSVFCSELNEQRKALSLAGGRRLIDIDLVRAQDASEIIARFYARAVEGVPGNIRALIEERLVIPPSLSSPTGARNSVAFEELTDDERAAVEPLISKWRILRLEVVGRQRQMRLELTHDVLLKPVLEGRQRSLARARAEAEQTAHDRAAQERLEKERAERLAMARQLEEQRGAQRRMFRWLAVCGVFAIVAVVALAFALNALNEADSERDFAGSLALGPDVVQVAQLARDSRQPEALAKAAALMRANPGNSAIRNLTINLLVHNDWWLPVASTGISSSPQSPGVNCSSTFSPDGTVVMTQCPSGAVTLWNPETGGTKILAPSAAVSATFSADGGQIVTCSSSGVEIWNVRSGEPVRSLPHAGASAVYVAEFSSDGQRLVTGASDGMARIWSAATWEPVRVFRHEGPIVAAHFSRDAALLVTAAVGPGGGARIWDVATGRLVMHDEIPASNGFIDAVLSADGQLLASVVGDAVRLSAVKSRGPAVILQAETLTPITSVQFGAANHLLAVQGGRVWLWDLGNSPRSTQLPIGGFVSSASFDGSGQYVVVASQRDAQTEVRVWDTASSRIRSSFVLPGRSSASARFDSSATRIVTTQDGGAAVVWRVSAQPAALDLGAARSAQFGVDGRNILLESETSDDRESTVVVSARDSATGALAATIVQEHLTPTGEFQVRFARDVDRVLTVNGAAARLFAAEARGQWQEIATQAIPCTGAGQDANVESSVLGARGTKAAFLCKDGSVHVWDVAVGLTAQQVGGDESEPVVSLDLSPDGSRLATTRWHSIRLSNTQTGAPIGPPLRSGAASGGAEDAQRDVLIAAWFSRPDGQQIVSTTSAGEIQLWQPDRDPAPTVRRLDSAVRWVWFTSGPWPIVTATADTAMVRLWASDGTAAPLRPLLSSPPIADFDVGRDGRRAVALFNDGTLRLWDMRTLHPETGDVYVPDALRARFDPTGTRVVVTGVRGATRTEGPDRTIIIDIPRVEREDIDWLSGVVTHVTGYNAGGFDLLERLPDWVTALSLARRSALQQSTPEGLREKIERRLFGSTTPPLASEASR